LEKEVHKYVKKKTDLAENLRTAYSLVWGQLSVPMRQRADGIGGDFQLPRPKISCPHLA
jgi:hypothetical protein